MIREKRRFIRDLLADQQGFSLAELNIQLVISIVAAMALMTVFAQVFVQQERWKGETERQILASDIKNILSSPVLCSQNLAGKNIASGNLPIELAYYHGANKFLVVAHEDEFRQKIKVDSANLLVSDPTVGSGIVEATVVVKLSQSMLEVEPVEKSVILNVENNLVVNCWSKSTLASLQKLGSCPPLHMVDGLNIDGSLSCKLAPPGPPGPPGPAGSDGEDSTCMDATGTCPWENRICTATGMICQGG